MDREILFRGKRTDNGKWVEGFWAILPTDSGEPEYTIIEPVDDDICLWHRPPVDPATVGQYTGLKNRNGKRIFEGDIIKARQAFCGELLCRGVVEYRNLRWEVPEDDFVVEESSLIEYEVIGNIYDNPELC